MIFFRLALKSLWNRKFTTALTVLSIALSTALLLSVEKIRRASEEGFSQTISQVDLIVGARTSPINLILYTVFNIGSATNNISWKSYQELKTHPAIDWTIPYSLGDGHRGFRVVGTNSDFFEHYRYMQNRQIELREGQRFSGLWDVVIGSQVSKDLQYKLGDKITIAHGVTKGEGLLQHDDKPFTVVGIMKPTGTALDHSLYISLQGLEALHIDWVNGAMPNEKTRIKADDIHSDKIEVTSITAFFLRTKNRIETLRLQRELNTFEKEPLLAIIPGVTLHELWRSLAYVEQAFKVISWLVIAVGLIAMMIALLTGLNERRREMAILRALGVKPQMILGLLVFESTILSLAGIFVGTVLQMLTVFLISGWIESEFGLVLAAGSLQMTEIIYLLLTLGFGILTGLIPALKAQSQALKDGLSVKV